LSNIHIHLSREDATNKSMTKLLVLEVEIE